MAGPAGLWVGTVTRVDGDDVWVAVPRLTGAADIEYGNGPMLHADVVLVAGDRVLVGFVEGDAARPVIVARLAVGSGGVLRRFSALVGDGVTTVFVLTHNLGTRDITPVCRQAADPWEYVVVEFAATTVDTVTVTFAVAPTANEYVVIVDG